MIPEGNAERMSDDSRRFRGPIELAAALYRGEALRAFEWCILAALLAALAYLVGAWLDAFDI